MFNHAQNVIYQPRERNVFLHHEVICIWGQLDHREVRLPVIPQNPDWLLWDLGRVEVLQSTVNTIDIQYTEHLSSIILNPFLQQTSKYSFLQQIYNMSSIQRWV